MAATFYFSGVDRADHLSLLAQDQAAGMVNARIALQSALYKAYMTTWKSVPLVLDSGAFQGNSDIVAYANLIEQVGSRFQWVSNLDAIWQPAVGERNFAYLQAHLSPALRDKVLWIYQPGGSLADVKWFARTRGHIGIGGLVPLLKQKGIEAVLRLLATIGECLEQENGVAHVFGISSPQILFRIRSERWLASVDSSKWLIAYKAREVVRKDGTHQSTLEQLGLCLKPREMAANNIRVMQFWLLPAVVMQSPLLGMEEEVVVEEKKAEEELYKQQFYVLLRGDCEEFMARFSHWIMRCDGSDEDNEESIFDLHAPSFVKEELLDWCEEARCKNLLRDYCIYDEEVEYVLIAA